MDKKLRRPPPAVRGLQIKHLFLMCHAPYISKLLEKVRLTQLKNYKYDNKLNEELQSAYKTKHSTHTALLNVFNDILVKSGQHGSSFITLLDLLTAFDAVDHNLLLRRL